MLGRVDTAETFKGTLYALLAVTFILWNRALRMIPTGRSSNCALLVPILSLVCIAVVLKERIDNQQALGMAIVLSSVFLNVRLAGRS